MLSFNSRDQITGTVLSSLIKMANMLIYLKKLLKTSRRLGFHLCKLKSETSISQIVNGRRKFAFVINNFYLFLIFNMRNKLLSLMSRQIDKV
jgi:hypothetical protein